MHFSCRALIAVLAILALSASGAAQTPKRKTAPANPSASSAAKTPASAAMTERQRAIHALNRLTFGPRPGDVSKVLAKGVDAWIEDQLHPESISDGLLDARLSAYITLRMPPKQLAQTFPSDAVIRQVVAGKRPLPADPMPRLVYSVQVARIKQQAANQAATVKPASDGGATPVQDQARDIADNLLAMPKEKRLAALLDVLPEQLINFPNMLRPDQRDRLNTDFKPAEREVFYSLNNPTGVVANELQQAKILRALLSERQLLEVMTDFWFNHFNVYQYKGADAYFTTAYERDVIRPHALGKFSDLLVATAQSPAMLFYLDNWLSIGPHSAAAGKNPQQSGLNENYGRELMELHTLGVDGGYTQADVTEAARVFTGWTINQVDDGGEFAFDPRRHEPGNKKILGQTFYEAGSDEGMHLLDVLAHHPSTAHFVSKKLAQRFVADDPPESLVKQMAATFLSSDGDIREVLRTMFKSPEFWSPKYYRVKLKTPLEFLISALRASSADVSAPDAILQNLTAMGMQPYGMLVPTGYSMKAETWENEGALLSRINFATALSNAKLNGVRFDPAYLMMLEIVDSAELPKTRTVISGQHTGLDLAMALIEDAVLAGDLSAKDEAIIRQQVEDPAVQRQMAASPVLGLRLVTAFVLASPEFQHR
jgi:uncharacterized protein (DUF1800 family)